MTSTTTPSATLTMLDRAEGALWGQACGDAFGMPNSFLRLPTWRLTMQPGPPDSPYHAGYPAGRITDDTEQAQSLTGALLAGEGTLDATLVADELRAWLHRVGGPDCLAVGPSTKIAIANLERGVPVEEAGVRGVTNGAPMRVSVVGVWAALRQFTFQQLLDDVRTACVPTHNTSVAISGAAAVAAAVWAGMQGMGWPETLSTACTAAREGERMGRWVYAPSVAARIEQACAVASSRLDEPQAARVISELVGMGEATAESVPAAFACAHYAGGNPEIAIRLAANAVGDTDTVAAMAGAICGARTGPDGLPAAWRDLVAEVNRLDVSRWAASLVTPGTPTAISGT